MDYDNYIAKVAELMDAAKADALEQAKVAWDSGALDTGKFENDYVLPKIFVTAYANRFEWLYAPLTNDYKKEVKNLKHFI